MQKLLPGIDIPEIYTQIGAFNQSIIVNRNAIGISLDKYLGSEYPLYKKFYTAAQRETNEIEVISQQIVYTSI